MNPTVGPARRAAVEQRLKHLRVESISRIASLRGEVADVIDSASSTTGDDEHDPEGATIGFERAQSLALLDQAKRRLAEIDEALTRLHDATYGTCASCGRPVDVERLDARPAAALCLRCASSLHR